MSPQFSLIMATYGRTREVIEFLRSLTCLEPGSPTFEVLIIDQNDHLDLDPLLAPFQSSFPLKHIKSSRRGLSLSRNIGLQQARGEIVAFPDDDCTYYPDTLKKVMEKFSQSPELRLCLARIFDRKTDKNLIKNWPELSRPVGVWDFYFVYSSITIFSKNTKILFDRRMGNGARYGSSEDFDYIYRNLRRGETTIYFPDIHLWHPDQVSVQFSDEKIYSYGEGFGACCRKNLSLPILSIFLQAMAFHTAQMLFYLLTGKFVLARRKWLTMKGRLHAFFTLKAEFQE